MSGVLDVAVYSDTTADESVDGVAGFDFRALSPGITADDRRRIREELLHRVHPTWSHDHDALAHPPTAAYARLDGRHYLARGHSTGLTLGGRPGNLVTQVLVTDDAAAFGRYQPAQLYAATTAWTLAETPSGALEPWPAPVAVRPEFEAAALRAMLRDDPWAVQVLPGYLTMLEAAARDVPHRLVLVHRELDVVMRWLAAGALLLGDELSSRLTYRALVDDPSREHAAVVGVSPVFELEPIVGAHVIDLERRTTTGVVPSDTARALTTTLLAEPVSDPAAFELAAAWEPHVGPELAARAASALHGAIPSGEAWLLALALVDALDESFAATHVQVPHPSVVAALAAWSPSTADEIRTARATRDRLRRLDATRLADLLDTGSRVGLARVVTGLAADLRAHDRAAERAVIGGRWDWLAAEPDAAPVHPWLEAAAVSHLPREQQADVLASVRLRVRTWPVAIGRPILPRDNLLVAAWLRHQGIDAALAAVIRPALHALRGSHAPGDPSYDDLLDAVLHARYFGSGFPDDALARLAIDYAPVHQRLVAARAGVSERANTTLVPLVADLEEWGPAVAPFLGECLLDAVDRRAVDHVAGAAGTWATDGVRGALRRRFAAAGRSATARVEVVRRAVTTGDAAPPAMAVAAVRFLTEDLRPATLARLRTGLDRGERDRLRALPKGA